LDFYFFNWTASPIYKGWEPGSGAGWTVLGLHTYVVVHHKGDWCRWDMGSCDYMC